MSVPRSHRHLMERELGNQTAIVELADDGAPPPLIPSSVSRYTSTMGPRFAYQGYGPASSHTQSSYPYYPAHTTYNGYVYVATSGMNPGQVTTTAGSISDGTSFDAQGVQHQSHLRVTTGSGPPMPSNYTTQSRPGSSSNNNPYQLTGSRLSMRRASTNTGEPEGNMRANSRINWTRQNTDAATEAIRPQFRSKVVCELTCRHCLATVCRRGMKAILLADMNDGPPVCFQSLTIDTGVQLVNDDYQTRNCYCRIRDVACLGCGNVIGYHVTQPCEPCMEACNNGHFWMFHISEVAYADRLDAAGARALLWAHLPRADKDSEFADLYEKMCR